MWQMDAIQDNIHLFLEVVPLLLQSVSGVPKDKERQYDQSATGGLCAWQGAAIYNHSTRKVSNTCQELLISGLCQYFSMQAGSDAITMHQTAASQKGCHTQFQCIYTNHPEFKLTLVVFLFYIPFLWFLPNPTYRLARTSPFLTEVCVLSKLLNKLFNHLKFAQ